MCRSGCSGRPEVHGCFAGQDTHEGTATQPDSDQPAADARPILAGALVAGPKGRQALLGAVRGLNEQKNEQ